MRKTFFCVDTSDTVLGGEDDRFCTGEAGCGDTDEVRLFSLDHRLVIEIGVGDAKALREPFKSLLAAVCDGYNFYPVDGRVGAEVAVRSTEASERNFVLDQTAHAAGADDSRSIFCAHRSLLVGRPTYMLV